MFFSHTTPHISQSITLANAQPLKVTMGEDTQTLAEVVVTALGIKREQKALSYNVQQVKGEALTDVYKRQSLIYKLYSDSYSQH